VAHASKGGRDLSTAVEEEVETASTEAEELAVVEEER